MHILLRQNRPDIAWTPCIPFVALNLLSNGLTSAVIFATTRHRRREREREREARGRRMTRRRRTRRTRRRGRGRVVAEVWRLETGSESSGG